MSLALLHRDANTPEPWWRSSIIFPPMSVPIAFRDRPHPFLTTPAVRALEDAPDPPRATQAIMIQAGVGAGKTVALRNLQRYYVEEGACDCVAFFDAGTLITLLHDPATRGGALRAAIESDVCFIDDLGSSYTPEFAAGLIEEIVITRESRWLQLVASTNLTPREFERKFGPRVMDRWRGSWGVWLDVQQPSLRRKPRQRS